MNATTISLNFRIAVAVFALCNTAGLIADAGAQNALPSPSVAPQGELKTAIFAGGCFWCMQYAFDRVPGVTKTVVGYTGGTKDAPDYEEVSGGKTGHAESIEVFYDPGATTYDKLLQTFWLNIDPTQRNGQFADHGSQYRSAIFTLDDEQRRQAEASKAALTQSEEFKGKTIVTAIVPAGKFYPAEDYHQKYYQKAPEHFQAYEIGSGRAGYVEERAKRASPATKP